MYRTTKLSIGLAVACAMAVTSMTQAQVFVGSYQVDEGPFWTENPAVYTAQEGAAIVFGGVASDYLISTNPSMDPGTITNTGWYSIVGVGGGTEFAHDFSLDLGGPGYAAPGWIDGDDISDYVQDNAAGPKYTN